MSHTRKLFLFVLILGIISGLFLFPARVYGQDEGQIDVEAVDAYLREQVKANRIPGMAVAIVQGDQVIFSKGYGEAVPGKPVTPQTQFYIGSVSKSFTALAALQLVDEGKLELDAPVQKYLPWFQVADPQASAAITVRNLLNHTSGLSEKGDPNPSAYTGSLDAQGRLLKDVRPNAPAGSLYQYYNQNYRLVGLLVETVSGQTFGEYLRDHIFTPTGMTLSTTNPEDAPDLAQGHSRFLGFPLPQNEIFVPGAVPSGYVITTADDMAKFLLAQINNRQANGEPLLSSESLAAMRTTPSGIASEYGMGWMVMENGNTLAHGGALNYFNAFEVIGLKEKTGLVILSNQNSLETMLLENNAIRDGLLAILNGKTPSKTSYGWVGWLLLALAAADLGNHIRLYVMLPRWVKKTARQPRAWLWVKVAVGVLFPLAVIFGVPQFVHTMQGGAPSWAEGYKLLPDVTLWLLLGMGLNALRSMIHAVLLVREK